eukprot:282818_1
MLIPFELFECSKLFKYYQIEQILINKCKDWIILNDDLNQSENQNAQNIITITNEDEIEYNYIGKTKHKNLMKKLLAPAVDYEDVALLDEVVYEFKLYQNYNLYLTKTLKYRKFINCETTFSTDSNYVEIKINQLIPDWTETNENRHQLFELIITNEE